MKKIKYIKKFISFILIFSLFFTQSGVITFANSLSDKSNLTVSKISNEDNITVKPESSSSNNENTKTHSHNNDPKKYEDNLKKIEEVAKKTLKDAKSGELMSIGNLSLGKGILPKKLPKLVKGQLPFPDYKGGYYYNQLNLNRKIAYQVYLWVIENVQPLTFVDVSALGLERNDFYAIHQVVLMENPEIFHARGIMIHVDNNSTEKVTHIYYISAFKLEEIKRMKKKLDDAYKLAVLNVKSSLDKNYTRLDAIKAIHDYVGQTTYGAICEASEHPTPDHFSCTEFYKQHSIYGVFVDRRAVCEGKTHAVLQLAKEFGIPVLVDAGTPKVLEIENHAWNLVQMDDGKWYVNDVTADGKSYHNGENKFDNFLISEKSNKIAHEHDPYLLGYNSSVKAQIYKIPELAQEDYIKINVKYPNNRVEFYRTFKSALEDIKSNNLSGEHKILLTYDYNLTSEEVELFKEFKTEKDISFEFSSIEDVWLLRSYSLGSETGNLYLPNDTKFSNINYDVKNLYTQGNKVSFYGKITKYFR